MESDDLLIPANETHCLLERFESHRTESLSGQNLGNLINTFIMQRRNSSISLLSSTVPQLETNIQSLYDPILKSEVIANRGDCILFELFSFKSIDKGSFAGFTLADKAYLN